MIHSESSSSSSSSDSDSEITSGRLNCSAISRCKFGNDVAKIDDSRFVLNAETDDEMSSWDVAGVVLSWLLELDAKDAMLLPEMDDAGE